MDLKDRDGDPVVKSLAVTVGLMIGLAATVCASAPCMAQASDSGAPSPRTPAGLVDARVISRPTGAQVSALYPGSALRHGVAGQAEVVCAIAPTDRLESCAVRSEKPAGEGFGAAALQVAELMRVAPATLNGQPIPGGTFRVPVRFQISPPPPGWGQRPSTLAPPPAVTPPPLTTDPSSPHENPLPNAAVAPSLPAPPLRSITSLWIGWAFGLAVIAGIPAVRFWPQPRSTRKPPGAFA